MVQVESDSWGDGTRTCVRVIGQHPLAGSATQSVAPFTLLGLASRLSSRCTFAQARMRWKHSCSSPVMARPAWIISRPLACSLRTDSRNERATGASILSRFLVRPLPPRRRRRLLTRDRDLCFDLHSCDNVRHVAGKRYLLDQRKDHRAHRAGAPARP